MTLLKQIKHKLKEEVLAYTIGQWIKLVLLIATTVLIGSLAVLYLMDMMYVLNVASDPCGVCREFNPNIQIITNQIKINWSNLNITQQVLGKVSG